MKSIRLYSVWALLCVPAIVILYLYVSGGWSYGRALGRSGEWSVWFLIMVLVIRPLKRAFPSSKVVYHLMTYRRALGVAVFAYAALHLIIYLIYKADSARIFNESLKPELLTGWAAFMIFIPLAYTSRNIHLRKLGKRWAKLHRWIYPAAILVGAHWVLTAFDPTSAYVHLGIIIALLLLRIRPRKS